MFENIKDKLDSNFPKLQIRFKNQSTLMKLIGFLLFFNKSFMTSFSTTIGNNVYFSSEESVNAKPINYYIILMHELVHVYDASRLSRLLFSFLYLFPQSLLPLAALLFFFSWKVALVAMVICALPLPAYFRMYFEKRAYMVNLYVIYKLNNKYRYNINLARQRELLLENFKNSNYYFMWTFNNIDTEFTNALNNIVADKHPYEDPVFEKLDDIINSY